MHIGKEVKVLGRKESVYTYICVYIYIPTFTFTHTIPICNNSYLSKKWKREIVPVAERIAFIWMFMKIKFYMRWYWSWLCSELSRCCLAGNTSPQYNFLPTFQWLSLWDSKHKSTNIAAVTLLPFLLKIHLT